MTTKTKIACIGLSNLHVIAIREIVNNIPRAELCLFPDFSSFRCVSEKFNSFVTTAEIYLYFSSFFLPRKQQAIVIFTSSPYSDYVSSVESGPSYIFPDTDEAQIENIFHRISARVKNDEESSPELSVREKDVLRKIASGLTNKEIADNLNISVNTVITHRKNISSKLGIRSASGLSLYALMNGII